MNRAMLLPLLTMGAMMDMSGPIVTTGTSRGSYKKPKAPVVVERRKKNKQSRKARKKNR